jgi:hypothetical protein
MSKLIWDADGDRLFETGVNQGVLYPQNVSGLYPLGVAWNGLTGVTESPSGAEPNPLYADNIKYLNLMSAEEFGATVEAYTYPDEFEACDGSAELAPGVMVGQQNRKGFGLSYKTLLGNDAEGTDHGYKLHLVYGAKASPSEKSYETVNETPDAITFSWDITTTPVAVPGMKPSASITIDSTKVDPTALAALEDILYGTAGGDPRLPLPAEVAAIMGGGTHDALTVDVVPADGAEAVAVGADVVLTFNNKIAREAVVVTKDDGTIVAGTKTFDADGKVLTFNPNSNFSEASSYLVTIGGVVDIYNQPLAASVINFTTA